ncbi:MAG: hypothetical protein JW795_03170 [Chitinivibrionales bacterium]|nr:hypothetical protein [Chitinivibrionales bacterium]
MVHDCQQHQFCSDFKDRLQSRQLVVTQPNKGPFWKPCPGTGSAYLCCGYQILSPVAGCGMYCAYCILQEYLTHSHQIVYENLSELETEVRQKLASVSGIVRFGTGELADSLYLEHRYGFSKRIIKLLEPYPNVCVELKTKSAAVESLVTVQCPGKVIIGFSLNTPWIISTYERGTATLVRRLAAAQWCIDHGFWIAFHLDPIVWYDTWKADYKALVHTIFQSISMPSRIAWWSLGCLRTMPSLRSRLLENKSVEPLFSGEMILGSDKKLRYFRPIRAAMYATIAREIERLYPPGPLYLCMESPEVWQETAMIQRIPHGLVHYLDGRAEEILKRV